MPPRGRARGLKTPLPQKLSTRACSLDLSSGGSTIKLGHCGAMRPSFQAIRLIAFGGQAKPLSGKPLRVTSAHSREFRGRKPFHQLPMGKP